MTFDKETLQTLLNLPDIAVDRVVLGEHRHLKSMCIARWRVRTVIAVVGQSIMSMAMVKR
jgi:soluble P-type ATPase